MSSIKLKGSSSGEAILTTDATASKFSFDKNLTASGDISASFIRGEGYVVQGKSLGNVIGGELVAFGYQNETKIQIGRFDNPTKIVGNITASGNISCSGELFFDTINGGTF